MNAKLFETLADPIQLPYLRQLVGEYAGSYVPHSSKRLQIAPRIADAVPTLVNPAALIVLSYLDLF